MAIVALCAKVARMSWDIDEDDGPVGDDLRARVVAARSEYDAMRAEIARLKAANASPDLGAGVVVPIDYVALGIIQDARDVLAKTFKNGDVYGLIARIDAWLGKAGG